VVRGFKAPEIDEVAPDGNHLFVTDGTTGQLSVFSLTDPGGCIARVPIGPGAHHIAVSPDMRRLWIALGEQAQTIAIVNSADLGAPRVIARFHPGFAAHDLAFDPTGTRVWVTSSSEPYVSVFDARTRRLLFRVPAGAPPQHIAFAGRYAYITTGYGSSIEQVRAADGHVLRHASTPYGSFELDAAGGYLATASLLDGRLAVYTPALHLLRSIGLAPATRDVAIAP
jgi:DNA-binding beta-propeller fold protein YncE